MCNTLNSFPIQVEIKVWTMSDSNYIGELGWRKYRRYSVFLGGLPRTCSAGRLAW
jgi:hypothetical protein